MKAINKIIVSVLAVVMVATGFVLAPATTSSAASQNLIEKGAAWKYLDDGSDQGTSWKEESFNDAAWKQGAAPLGYKYSVKTQVSYGPDSDNKYITTYFRNNFQVTDPSQIKTLKASVFLDDGAVFYINGKEVHRENMPEGNVSYKTFTKDTLGTVTEDVTFNVDPSVLKKGTNTIAVEVHQRSAGSSDIVFDMNLIANEESAPAPTIPTTTDVKHIVFSPGKNSSEVNFNWISANSTVDTVLQIAKKSDMTGSAFPEDKTKTFTGVKADASQGFSSNKLTVTGLTEATSYIYRIKTGDNLWTPVYDYSTEKTDSFSFLLAGDPQIGSSGNVSNDTNGWVDTMKKAVQKFPNASFLASLGDQIENASNEAQYDGYFKPEELKNLPVAALPGNHDNDAGTLNHFNAPNQSQEYGVTNAGGDYYFTYGNTLFMVLNSNNKSAAGHKAFMEKAITANPNATWKVVMFHHSMYSSANHSTEESIANFRNAMFPVMDELKIDVVLAGHDHNYTRSYQMKGGIPQKDQKLDDKGRVVDPTGTLYITANSASGSKYYTLKAIPEEYAAVRSQIRIPTFSRINVTSDGFYIDTYRTDTMEITDSYSIFKSDALHEATTNVINDIDKLKAASEVTLKDEAEVQKLRLAYDALDDTQKKLVTNYDKLTTAEGKIAELKAADQQAASAVAEKINAIEEEVKLEDKSAVEAARADYDKLTDAQKALVTNYSKLTAAEDKIAELEKADEDKKPADNTSSNSTNNTSDNGTSNTSSGTSSNTGSSTSNTNSSPKTGEFLGGNLVILLEVVIACVSLVFIIINRKKILSLVNKN